MRTLAVRLVFVAVALAGVAGQLLWGDTVIWGN
jgi:hypothetical protein